jgi:glycosyltransferase involved in cell wall biosynthesis
VFLDMGEHYPAIMRELWTSGRNRRLDFVVRNPRVVEWVERYCVTRVDHILTVVEESSSRLERMGVPAGRMSVVGNTPSQSQVRSGAGRQPAARHANGVELVYLGLLEMSRGLQDVIAACAILAGEGQRVRLLIIGSGRDEAILRKRASETGLSDSVVRFAGFVPHAEAMRMLGSSDIGMLPIHVNDHMNTTVPNKLFDYMSVGLPVITSDSAPSARVVSETGCGEVFRARDVGDLVRAIKALADPAVRRVKGDAGRAAVMARYNWENDARVLLNAIENHAVEDRATVRR